MPTSTRSKKKVGAAGNGQGSEPSRQRSSYDEIKEFEGKRYTGMKIGRRHKWRYDQGEWTEKKVTPDRWEFQYAVIKRRAGKAPEGSGAPVGTAYHWYILADQVVTKLDANSYMTEMVGRKFKLAHRRADKESWSASERSQRKRMTVLLQNMIEELETAPPPTVTSPDGADGADGVDGQTATAATKSTKERAPARRGRATPSRARAAQRPKAAAATRRPPRGGAEPSAGTRMRGRGRATKPSRS